MPPYAVAKDDVIRGTIANFDGASTIYVRDIRGYVDNVTLHKGTIINPTGIRLQAGFPVTISLSAGWLWVGLGMARLAVE